MTSMFLILSGSVLIVTIMREQGLVFYFDWTGFDHSISGPFQSLDLKLGYNLCCYPNSAVYKDFSA